MACLELLKIGFLMRIIENPIQPTGSFSIIWKSGGEKNRRLNWEPAMFSPRPVNFPLMPSLRPPQAVKKKSEIELGAENPAVLVQRARLGPCFHHGQRIFLWCPRSVHLMLQLGPPKNRRWMPIDVLRMLMLKWRNSLLSYLIFLPYVYSLRS